MYRWHARPGAFQRLTPPWAPVELLRHEGIDDGDRAELRLGPALLGIRWIAEHEEHRPGRGFRDRQVSGPFARWVHTHRFEPTGETSCRLVDKISYALPGGRLGHLLGEPRLRRELARQFAYRHRITRSDLELHDRYAPDEDRWTVAVSGASGLIGRALTAFLRTGGHRVRPLVRREVAHQDEIRWDPARGSLDGEALEDVDAVVHLAGEPIYALRWTEKKKRRIARSRVQGTRLLATTIANLADPPEAFLSASGTAFYGRPGAERVDESRDPVDPGFLGEVCQRWEAATRPASKAGIRTCRLRIGAVLTPAGGILARLLPVFRMRLGGRLTPEDPFVPWIAIEDVIGGIYHLMATADAEGPVNLTSPRPVRTRAFTETLAEVLGVAAPWTVPSTLVETVLGEMGTELLLSGTRAEPGVLESTGYRFLYPNLRDALAHQLGRTE